MDISNSLLDAGACSSEILFDECLAVRHTAVVGRAFPMTLPFPPPPRHFPRARVCRHQAAPRHRRRDKRCGGRPAPTPRYDDTPGGPEPLDGREGHCADEQYGMLNGGDAALLKCGEAPCNRIRRVGVYFSRRQQHRTPFFPSSPSCPLIAL